MTVDAAVVASQADSKPEKFGPGSDIHKDHPDQVIDSINNTHILALNAYPVFRPQYLLLTLDSYRSQDEPMDLQDFAASWKFLHSTPDPHFVMYNCTKDAGCSRYHKHMQILKRPELANIDNSRSFRFFPDVKGSQHHAPYVYFLHQLDHVRTEGAEAIFSEYTELLRQCRKVHGLHENDTKSLCPHNVLLVKEWLIVIPRQRGSYGGVSANAAGMMGMPTIADKSSFQAWIDKGPTHILQQLGVPDYNT
jgi:ATP adenylyltransferase/5',5'''-P-1,P-4-tetraphosphate phosphorylase II